MTHGIFIVSYLPDLPWFRYCLGSIRKFCSGFDRVTVAVAREEAEVFGPICERAGAVLKLYDRVPDRVRWHLQSSCVRACADLYCEEDFIFQVDSDCWFTEPVTPRRWFVNEKPLYAYERFENIPPDHRVWQAKIRANLKRQTDYCFMCAFPFIHTPELLLAVRTRLEEIHGQPFLRYAMTRKPTWPWGFGPFNVSGAFAFYTSPWRESYTWAQSCRMPWPAGLKQAWSFGPRPRDEYARLGIEPA